MPDSLPDQIIVWNQGRNAYEWTQGGKVRLENVYELEDGLGVAIEQAELTSEVQSGGVLFKLEFDVFVFDLPRHARKDYPWQPGDREYHSITGFRDLTTGRVTEFRTLNTSVFASAFEITETKVVPKAHARDIELAGAIVRVTGMKGDAIKKFDGVTYHYVTVRILPVRVTNPDAMMLDSDGHVIRLKQGVQVEAREAFAVPTK